MRIYLLLVAIVYCSHAMTQPLRRILDIQTGLPVSYATIKVFHAPRGIIASEKGEFRLLIEKADSVLISSVGYFQMVLIGEKIGTTIFLAPKIKSLPEVSIGKKKFLRTVVLGNKIKKSDDDLNWGPGSDLKEEFAQRIDLPDSTLSYKIKKVYVPIGKVVCWGPLLVRVYIIDSISEFPGEAIFFKYVSINSENIKKKKAVVDLNDENLYLYHIKSFFISVAWPQDSDNNRCITAILLSRSSDEITYSRYLTSNSYNWFPFGQFQDLNGKPYAAKTVFSVELDEMR